jgi:hypothetical protein
MPGPVDEVVGELLVEPAQREQPGACRCRAAEHIGSPAGGVGDLPVSLRAGQHCLEPRFGIDDVAFEASQGEPLAADDPFALQVAD